MFKFILHHESRVKALCYIFYVSLYVMKVVLFFTSCKISNQIWTEQKAFLKLFIANLECGFLNTASCKLMVSFSTPTSYERFSGIVQMMNPSLYEIDQ
jgi:hypothetical protein